MKRWNRLMAGICSLLLLILTVSCAGNPGVSNPEQNSQTAGEKGVEFTDALGHTIKLGETPERVVSFFGSFAETWMLAGGELCGTTEDAVSERKLDLSEDVKIIGTVKEPNLEEVFAAEPDFVILSADIESHVKAGETLTSAGIPHAYFHVEGFEEYLAMLKIFTELTNREDLYIKNGLQVQEQIDAVLKKAEGEPSPSILFVRAFSTGAKAKSDDNMTCQMLDALGTENIAKKHPSLLEDLSMEEVIAENPDFIFVVVMGENSEKALNALHDTVESNPAWKGLSAVINGRYIVLPKDLFHYKPNARWGEAYEYLAKLLYPDIFGAA